MQDGADRVHRIYTAEKHRDLIAKLVSSKFESFTMHRTTGYFKAKPERSMVIEIVNATEQEVMDLARRIAKITQERSVLVMALRGDAKVVGRER